VVIELDSALSAEWTYSGPEGGHSNFKFASASSPDGAECAVEVWLNDELVEKVYLAVPHSWWPPTQVLGADSYGPDDTLLVRAVDGRVAFRLELDEFGLED
jgi:hypothetical protein